MHAEPRLLGEVVDAVDGGEEACSPAPRRCSSVRAARRAGVDEQRGLVAEEDRVEHAVRVGARAAPGRSARGRSRQALGALPAAGHADRVLAPRRRPADSTISSVPAAAVARRASPASGCAWICVRSLRIPCISASGRGGQPGTWTSTGMNLSAGHDRVVVEDAHRGRAGAHRDRPLGLEHLVVDAPDDRRHLDRDAARQDEQVGLARRGAEGLEAEARDVHARGDDRHHLDRAAGQAEGRRARSRCRGPSWRPCSSVVVMHALLDVLLELGPVEVAAQHVARAQLARRGTPPSAPLGRAAAASSPFSAPLRQT